MTLATIAWLFVASAILTLASFWAHRRLAGDTGRPGAASMAAFVLGWLFALTALITGGFLLTTAFG